jgi:hypothetical protein
MTTPDHLLVKADIPKLAKKHGIPELWAREWMATWLARDR